MFDDPEFVAPGDDRMSNSQHAIVSINPASYFKFRTIIDRGLMSAADAVLPKKGG